MATKRAKKDGTTKKFRTLGGMARETVYVYEDEEKALESRAKSERCSKSEVIRRALRAYLEIKNT